MLHPQVSLTFWMRRIKFRGGARETDGLTETAAGGNKILKIRSDPIHPLATKNLSKECQLLNLIPTLGGY